MEVVLYIIDTLSAPLKKTKKTIETTTKILMVFTTDTITNITITIIGP